MIPQFGMLNLSRLREEAAERLMLEGHTDWKTIDFLTVGFILGRNGIQEQDDHPLATKFYAEAVDQKLGKWAFLVGLLDPWGLAATYPAVVGEIALTMLGKVPLHPTTQAILLERWEEHNGPSER